MSATSSIAAVAASFIAATTFAQVLDFETLPDGSTPIDNQLLPLGSVYTVPFNGSTLDVTIGFDVDLDGAIDSPAVFEAVGSDPVTGFQGNGADQALPAFADQLGQWFIRSQSALGSSDPIGILVAEYSQPVPGAAGEIWDIDGNEQWEIRGYRAGETVPTATVISPSTGLNGEPWIFSLADPTVGFSRLEIEYVGTRALNNVGLAFNNFSTSESIPGPTILTTQPLDEVRNADGFDQVSIYWTVPVTLVEDDVTVVTNDGLALDVPINITGSGTQITTVIFRGPPGGSGGGANDPLLNGSYRITIDDRARAASDNVPIDGDNDGIAGGDAEIIVTHRCLADLADPAGLLDLADIVEFVTSFNEGCE